MFRSFATSALALAVAGDVLAAPTADGDLSVNLGANRLSLAVGPLSLDVGKGDLGKGDLDIITLHEADDGIADEFGPVESHHGLIRALVQPNDRRLAGRHEFTRLRNRLH